MTETTIPGREVGVTAYERSSDQNPAGGSYSEKKLLDSKSLFLLGLLLAGSGLVSPPVALVGGVVFGFLVVQPVPQRGQFPGEAVAPGVRDFAWFWNESASGASCRHIGFCVYGDQHLLRGDCRTAFGKILRVGGKASYLITLGTAICGGSAIAALAPILEANEEEISISMGTVFLLNSVALLLFLRLDGGCT